MKRRMGYLLGLFLFVLTLGACANSDGQTAKNDTPVCSDGAIYRIANVATGNYLEWSPGGENVISESVSLKTAAQSSSVAQRFSLVGQGGDEYLLVAENAEKGVLVGIKDAGDGNVYLFLTKDDSVVADGENGIFVTQEVTERASLYWRMEMVSNEYFYTNPVKASGADPWVILVKDIYYLIWSDGNKNLYISKSDSLTDWDTAEETKVYTAPDSGEMCAELWAPELFFLEGRWYIYYAADDGDNANHRMYVLEGGDNPDDPLDGEYVFKSKIADEACDRWAIDGTVFTCGDEMYFVWSGWDGFQNVAQNLYIAKMSNPWTLSTGRVCISVPEYDWEKNGNPFVNEGPEVLIKNDKVHIVYSASGSWTDDYCLGCLTCDDGDFLNPDAWEKSMQPLFSKTNYVFGVGHASFVKSKDGTRDYIVYHAARQSGAGWDRNVRVQLFTWTAKDYPYFGEPIAPGVKLANTENGCDVDTSVIYKIENVETGRVLTTPTPVSLKVWYENDSDTQYFTLQEAEEKGWYMLVPYTAADKAIDNVGSAKEPGSGFRLYGNSGNNSQMFFIEETEEGMYRFVNRASLLAMTDVSESNGGGLEQQPLSNDKNQLWKLVPVTER